MWYIIIVITSAAAILFGVYGCNFKKGSTNIFGGNISPDDTVKGTFKRSAIKEKLEALANSPAPDELKPGAMCYAPRQERANIDYVCPVCGEKTLYAESTGWFIEYDLPKCRMFADSIPAINLRLDESQFCKKCSPGVNNPRLCIFYKLADDTQETHICNISVDDLKIMKEFMQGKEKHSTFNDGEEAMRDFLPRLQELFGIKIENEKK